MSYYKSHWHQKVDNVPERFLSGWKMTDEDKAKYKARAQAVEEWLKEVRK